VSSNLPNRLSIERLLFFLIVLLALALRLLNLGAAPLAEGEAELALKAFDVARGERAALDPQPGYVAITGVTFALFGSSEFAARLWPALIGGLLTLVPFFFRRILGREAALILALGLALDPGLVALSRQADGPMLAVGLTFLALGLAFDGSLALAGVAAGLALLSGPALLPGLLALILAGGASWVLVGGGEPFLPAWQNQNSLRNGLLAALLTLVLVGTLFLRFPEGLSAWLAGLPVYLSGWAQLPTIPALRLLAALVVYQPLPLIFGLIGAVRGWLRGDRLAQGLSLWLGISLILALIYPARQVSDLAWALLPLWALAARELSGLLIASTDYPAVSLGQTALIFVLLALIWMNLAGLGQLVPEAQGNLIRLAVIGGVLGLGAVTSSLVGLGWSWGAARQGLVWGLCAGLGVYTLAGMWGTSQLRVPGRMDLWAPLPESADVSLLEQTLADLSSWHIGEVASLDVTLAVDSPALRWVLRDYPGLSVVPESDESLISGSPSIVITRQSVEEPSLAASYRGQDFALDAYPGWAGALPPNLARWLVFRLAPLQEEQVILWARVDLFPGGSTLSASPLPESQQP
jgi:hypothetical protein